MYNPHPLFWLEVTVIIPNRALIPLEKQAYFLLYFSNGDYRTCFKNFP